MTIYKTRREVMISATCNPEELTDEEMDLLEGAIGLLKQLRERAAAGATIHINEHETRVRDDVSEFLSLLEAFKTEGWYTLTEICASSGLGREVVIRRMMKLLQHMPESFERADDLIHTSRGVRGQGYRLRPGYLEWAKSAIQQGRGQVGDESAADTRGISSIQSRLVLVSQALMDRVGEWTQKDDLAEECRITPQEARLALRALYQTAPGIERRDANAGEPRGHFYRATEEFTGAPSPET